MRSRKEEEEEESSPQVPEPPGPHLVEAAPPPRETLASTGETGGQETPPLRTGRWRNLRLVLALLLILGGGAGYGGYWWIWVRGTVSTDDAYVDSRIVSVASRLPERVDAVLVKEGQRVEKGQVIVRFASDRLRIQVRQARAAVRGALAVLDEKRNSPRPEEIEVARAEVRVDEVELNLQKKEVARAARLVSVKAISAQEAERRSSALDSARSRLEVSRRRLALLFAGPPKEEIQQAEAALELARARLQATQTELADAQLRAPVNGIVAKVMIDPGEVVQRGQAVAQIVETENSWVVANLEEDQIARVREGQPARLWIDAYPGREFRGRVGPVYAATLSRFSLLPSSSASGSFIKVTQRVPVRIDWAQDDLPSMYPGLNVIVRIQVD